MTSDKDPSGAPRIDSGSLDRPAGSREQAAENRKWRSGPYEFVMAEAPGAWPSSTMGQGGLWPLPQLEKAWIAGGSEPLQSEGTLYLGRTQSAVTVKISVLPNLLASGAGARGFMSGHDEEAHKLLRTHVGILTLERVPLRLMIRSASAAGAHGHFVVIREFPG